MTFQRKVFLRDRSSSQIVFPKKISRNPAPNDDRSHRKCSIPKVLTKRDISLQWQAKIRAKIPLLSFCLTTLSGSIPLSGLPSLCPGIGNNFGPKSRRATLSLFHLLSPFVDFPFHSSVRFFPPWLVRFSTAATATSSNVWQSLARSGSGSDRHRPPTRGCESRALYVLVTWRLDAPSKMPSETTLPKRRLEERDRST